MRRVAYQGEPGAFSEEAVRQCCPETDAMPCADFEELFTAVKESRADAVMAPVHNTLAGPIHASLRLLIEAGLFIIAETKVQVRMQLAGLPDARIEDLRVVRSHPVALKQCTAFLNDHPHIRAEENCDTAGSIRRMMQAGDPAQGAIGSARAVEMYGAQLLKADIQDVSENFTRFLLLTPEPAASQPADTLAFLVAENFTGRLTQTAERSGLIVSSILPVGSKMLMEFRGDEPDIIRAKAKLSSEFHLLGAYKQWHDATWT